MSFLRAGIPGQHAEHRAAGRVGSPPPCARAPGLRIPATRRADGALAFRVARATGSDEVVIAGDEPATLGAATLQGQIGVLRSGASAPRLVVPSR